MKTFDEAFLAALSIKDEACADELTKQNLIDQGQEVSNNRAVLVWAKQMADLAWCHIGDEVTATDLMSCFITGLASGVRIGIEMEKE